jgi:pimeloyl-ACP methyl ester carboxylesterase
MSLRAGMFFHQGLAHVDVLLASDPRQSLPKFKQPMLFVNGTLDHRDSEQIWKSLAGGSSELIDYEGGDHFFSHDDRFMDRFIQELTTFAKKVLQ